MMYKYLSNRGRYERKNLFCLKNLRKKYQKFFVNRQFQYFIPHYCFSDELDSYVKDCIDCYTHDWFVVEYCYRHHSTSSTVRDRLTEREILLQNIPRQEFELDLNERALSDDELHLRAVWFIYLFETQQFETPPSHLNYPHNF